MDMEVTPRNIPLLASYSATGIHLPCSFASVGASFYKVGFPNVAVGQNHWCHFGAGAPPILEPIFVGDWDVHGGVRFGF